MSLDLKKKESWMKFFLLFMTLFVCSCDKSTTGLVNNILSDQNGSNTSSDLTMTEEFMTLINDHRILLGLTPLLLDQGMSRIAEQHSADMADQVVPFGHDGFSTRCSDVRSLLGGGNLCAENVAMGQKTVLAAFNSWMNSPGHRANIEQSRVTHTGFGYKKSATGTYFWTQIFIEFN